MLINSLSSQLAYERTTTEHHRTIASLQGTLSTLRSTSASQLHDELTKRDADWSLALSSRDDDLTKVTDELRSSQQRVNAQQKSTAELASALKSNRDAALAAAKEATARETRLEERLAEISRAAEEAVKRAEQRHAVDRRRAEGTFAEAIAGHKVSELQEREVREAMKREWEAEARATSSAVKELKSRGVAKVALLRDETQKLRDATIAFKAMQDNVVFQLRQDIKDKETENSQLKALHRNELTKAKVVQGLKLGAADRRARLAREEAQGAEAEKLRAFEIAASVERQAFELRGAEQQKREDEIRAAAATGDERRNREMLEIVTQHKAVFDAVKEEHHKQLDFETKSLHAEYREKLIEVVESITAKKELECKDRLQSVEQDAERKVFDAQRMLDSDRLATESQRLSEEGRLRSLQHDLAEQLRASQDEKKAMQDQLLDLTGKVAVAERREQAVREASDKMSARLSASRRVIEDAEGMLKEKERQTKEIESLNTKLVDLAKALADAAGHQGERNHAVEKLEVDVEESRREAASLAAELERVKADCEDKFRVAEAKLSSVSGQLANEKTTSESSGKTDAEAVKAVKLAFNKMLAEKDKAIEKGAEDIAKLKEAASAVKSDAIAKKMQDSVKTASTKRGADEALTKMTKQAAEAERALAESKRALIEKDRTIDSNLTLLDQLKEEKARIVVETTRPLEDALKSSKDVAARQAAEAASALSVMTESSKTKIAELEVRAKDLDAQLEVEKASASDLTLKVREKEMVIAALELSATTSARTYEEALSREKDESSKRLDESSKRFDSTVTSLTDKFTAEAKRCADLEAQVKMIEAAVKSASLEGARLVDEAVRAGKEEAARLVEDATRPLKAEVEGSQRKISDLEQRLVAAVAAEAKATATLEEKSKILTEVEAKLGSAFRMLEEEKDAANKLRRNLEEKTKLCASVEAKLVEVNAMLAAVTEKNVSLTAQLEEKTNDYTELRQKTDLAAKDSAGVQKIFLQDEAKIAMMMREVDFANSKIEELEVEVGRYRGRLNEMKRREDAAKGGGKPTKELTRSEIDHIAQYIDSLGDGDGTIDLAEFEKAVRNNRRMKSCADDFAKGRLLILRLEQLIDAHSMTLMQWFNACDKHGALDKAQAEAGGPASPKSGKGDSRLTMSEVEEMLLDMSTKRPELENFTYDDVRELVKFMDPNFDGNISKSEFKDAFARGRLPPNVLHVEYQSSLIVEKIERYMVEKKLRVKDVFKVLDTDSDDRVTLKEFRLGVESLVGLDLSVDELGVSVSDKLAKDKVELLQRFPSEKKLEGGGAAK